MKAGLITFHGSHNFGSMLQTYATQQLLLQKNIDVEVINYRFPDQERYYSLYPSGFGWMRYLRSLLLLPYHRGRQKSWHRFEEFLKTYILLSGTAMDSKEELSALSERYDVLISGGDQIWSDKIPEFSPSGKATAEPYFLNFLESRKKRISFATSIGEASTEWLQGHAVQLKKYAFLSCREPDGADMLTQVTGKQVETLLDPTLLLERSEWENMAGNVPLIREKYVLLYSLRGMRPGVVWREKVRVIADEIGAKVIAITPFFFMPFPGTKCITSAGPKEFLNMIRFADAVFTDSFHGTAFAILFRKEFYTLTRMDRPNDRKGALLRRLYLECQACSSFEDLDGVRLRSAEQMDYDGVDLILEQEKQKADVFLSAALH